MVKIQLTSKIKLNNEIKLYLCFLHHFKLSYSLELVVVVHLIQNPKL